MSKDHFYFNRTDRIVALILLFIITAVNAVLYPWRQPVPETAPGPDSVVVPRDTVRRIVYIRDTVRRKWYVWDTVTIQVSNVRHSVKTRPSHPVDLNASDSACLVRLPGIGPATSLKILRYREQLGGYTATQQLLEIDGLPDSLVKWFIIGDSVPLRKIMVNESTLSELRRHPYVDFYQARAIVEYRNQRGKIKGPGQLSFMEEFTDRDLERLLPYLDFR